MVTGLTANLSNTNFKFTYQIFSHCVMDKNIDLKRRKPRQLRGTPANKFSLYVSGGVCAVGILCGLVL